MKIVFNLILLTLLSFKAPTQVMTLPKKINNIPSTNQNREFLLSIQQNFHYKIKDGSDSIALLYVNSLYTNYAIIFSRKDKKTTCEAYYQCIPAVSEVGKERLCNQTLDSVDFSELYHIFLDNEIRREDTTIDIFPQFRIYTAIYFRGKSTRYFVGHEGKFNHKLNLNILNQLIEEQNRIESRELRKSGSSN